MMLVVEGKPRATNNPPVGVALKKPSPGGKPYLQLVASRALGDGNPAVICPGSMGAGGDGIPAASFPDPDAAALRDFACRFVSFNVNDPCTLNSNGLSGVADPEPAGRVCNSAEFMSCPGKLCQLAIRCSRRACATRGAPLDHPSRSSCGVSSASGHAARGPRSGGNARCKHATLAFPLDYPPGMRHRRSGFTRRPVTGVY